ncbi:MAG TPA: M42 family metallopeptidase [Firmicutes bacterium]|uniref:M42 family metallopeptidase n=1 Tax=Candidatus Fermentithermobacillus carboniphilus TaxID=3085328 RepID=A0AAT9LAD0_9FIRM|nr:MAG: M42 family metallopeptidase [Candidatus Fermentithermobacillus carboniphilus]HHW18802.1 M42 family metallopeptidase [Candidatus Fermentithermobacillaceae bacterium]
MKDLIKKLTETFGPAGAEGPIREVIRKEVEPYVDEIRVDALGNLICHKKGQGGKKLLLDAHMDEIGLMVTHIDDNGFLRFGTIGGVNPYISLGQRVYFENGTFGVIGSEKIEDPKDVKAEKLFIDIGAKDKKSAEEKVKIGDSAAFFQPMLDLGSRVVAKAMDDRIGCAVIIETLRRLGPVRNEIYAVFAVQEEVGLRGARVAAFGIEPDVGVAFDVTRTGDTPKGITMEVALGKGAAIKVKDSSLICHPGLKEYMVKLATQVEIPYQLEVLEAGGTDSGAIQLTKAGIPAGVISIPCRYIHSPSEMVDLGDVEACIRLCKALCESPLDF